MAATPGPWTASRTPHGTPRVAGPGGRTIALMANVDQEHNAKLMAAAPNMLAALVAAHDAIYRLATNPNTISRGRLSEVEGVVRAAIAMAEGA